MSETILVVDDEESILSIFIELLGMEGYNVITASDGYEAIEKIESEYFDLAIVDINMPGPGGIEILKNIKSKREESEVIIISGYASLDTAIEAMRQGAYDYVVKPFDIKIIPNIIKRGIEKRKQIVETRQLLNQLEQRSFELAVLCELRDAIGYTLDYREFVGPIMDSLSRIVDHDASAFLFMNSEDMGELNIWTNHGASSDIVNQVKMNVINAFNRVSASSISEDTLSIYINKSEYINKSKNPATAEGEFTQLKSFLNVALVIRDSGEDRLAGMISISSHKEDAFDLGTSRLFYNIANNMSNAIERLTRVLAGEKSKLEMMVRSMTDGVIMFDQRGHIAVLNPAARKLLGLEEIINAGHLAKHIGNTRLSRAIEKFWDQRQPNGLAIGEYSFEEEFSVEKTRKFLSASVSPIKSDDGKTHGIVAVLRDITKRKEIDEAKTSFVSSVSHELRTPLTVIKNAISIIGMAGDTNEQQCRFLSISERNIERLERLINRILDFSRLEIGKLEMEFDFMDLKTLARESINAIQNLAANKSIEIIQNIPDDLPKIYADYHRLDQVLTNLLDNAIKYTPENGRITVEAKLTDRLRINGKSISMPQSLHNPGFIEVSVTDTGIGIPLEDQKRIFDRFEQVSTNHAPGVGLGLSIVKKIIENHYGEIWVESEMDKGSKFVFVLPANRKCNKIIDLLQAVDSEIETSKLDLSLFSMMMIQLENLTDISAKHGEEVISEVLTDITKYIERDTYIKKDIAFGSVDCGFIFCFYNGNKETVNKAEEQVSNFINQRMFPESDPAIKISFNSWIVTYPDDGKTAVELIDHLLQNCIPQAV